MSFESLGLSRPILDALAALNITSPTPIQTQAIPSALSGRDLIGLAQTGTGKTAAFSLPILQRLSPGKPAAPKRTRCLILSPTRELAAQIAKSVKDFGRRMHLRSTVVVGGVSIRPQIKNLAGGVDILIATPGRLEDLLSQRAVSLDAVEIVVLDEADQMLDIGFMPAIKRILGQTPKTRQTMLFSATMPKEIRELSSRHLSNPLEISVIPVTKTADRIEQSVIHLPAANKMGALASLVRDQKGERVIVFTRTKRGADKAARRLGTDGINAAAIHGNKSQGQRERALAGFRDGSVPVLIATDIAARGIDVPGVSLVVNYELPNVPEVYVHRIGRTARAGASGVAVTLCAPDERSLLRDVEKLLKVSVPVTKAPEGTFVDGLAEDADFKPLSTENRPRQNRKPNQRNGGNRSGASAKGHGRNKGGRPASAQGAPGEANGADKPAGKSRNRRRNRRPGSGEGRNRVAATS